MAKLPRYMKAEHTGTRQLDNGRWVADYTVKVAWWGWPLVLLWGLLHPRKSAYWASQDSCDGLTVSKVESQ